MGPLVSRATARQPPLLCEVASECMRTARLSGCLPNGMVYEGFGMQASEPSTAVSPAPPTSYPTRPAAGLHLSQPLPARRGSGGVGPHPVDRGARPMRVECPDGAGEAVPPRALLRRDARLPPRGVTAARALRDECCRRGALARSWAAAPVASFCRTRFERWMCGDAGLLCAAPGRVPDTREATRKAWPLLYFTV